MRKLLCFFFLLMFCGPGIAQTFTASRNIHYDLQNGLSFGIVNSICQDSRGFMWFATSDGLNRFDGNSFKVFKNEKDNRYSLSSNFVQAVFTDKSGTVWVSSREGLNKYDPQKSRFIHYRFTNEPGAAYKNDVSYITEGSAGNLWIATSNGFYYFSQSTAKLKIYNEQSLAGLPSNAVSTLHEDSKGWLWVGSRDKGVSVYHTKKGKVADRLNFQQNLEHGRVNKIYEDKNHDIWIATSGGLIHYRRNLNKFIFLNAASYGLHSNIFLSLVENHRGELLTGVQEGGLYEVALKEDHNQSRYTFEPVKGDNDLPLTNRTVQTLFQDRDKNIWVGTYGSGIYMMSSVNEKFKKFQQKQADENFVRYYGMCLDHEGNLWLGTDGNGIFKTTPSGKILKHYYANGTTGSIKDNAILSAYADSRGRLWFGTYQKGLFLYNPASDGFISFSRTTQPSSLGGNDVRVIYEDSRKRLWVGTNGGGLNLYNEASRSFIRFDRGNSSINSNDIRSIVEDKRGNLWVGTYGGGLNYFDFKTRRFTTFHSGKEKSVIANNVVFALHLDSSSNLWIGTEGDGLIRYNTIDGATKVFNEKSGLGNNTVNAIRAQDERVLWVSTNKGLTRIDTKLNALTNYDQSDGLQTGQFHEGSALYSKEGHFMVFGGTEGWNIFNPDEVRQSTFHPKVIITGLKLFGQREKSGESEDIKDITEASQITLNPDQSVFSLNYVMLDYAFPSEGEFAYKMEGLEKEWNYVKDQQSATYRYLDPGTYTFKVKAANHDGVWSSDTARITIKVLPPWYKTWWAYLFYTCSAVGLIYSYIQYRTQQAELKYEVRTAHFEAEQEKELHRKKVDFFTNISHEFRTPLTLIINPLKEMLYEEGKEVSSAGLNIVYRNARRLLSLVDQLLLFRKSESESGKLKIVKLNIADVCREVFLCFTHQAGKQKIELSFSSTTEDIEVYADREKLEIVLFNLVANALKFTPATGRVDIELIENDKNLLIKVKDTGPGIHESAGEKLFEQFYQVSNSNTSGKGGFGIGLFLVKSFVEAHKGKVEYVSRPGEGTTFIVSLLKGKDHFSSSIIFEEVPEASVFLEELIEDLEPASVSELDLEAGEKPAELYAEVKTILVIDDNQQIRQYVKQLFSQEFEVLEADNGASGLAMIKKEVPDVVISDVMMQGLSGIELCSRIKEDAALNHIPIILLTASSSMEVKLKGIECGADDFISKPFEKEILIARVSGILKSRNNLQNYFYNQVTLQPDSSKISAEYKDFLDRSIQLVEEHLADPDFGIKMLADKLAMSRSTLYLRIKSVSGQSGNSFIRSIRLRKAAQIFISSNSTVSETAYLVGIKDVKYFREQFNKLFGMNPSDYIRKYRKHFNSNHAIKKDVSKKGNST